MAYDRQKAVNYAHEWAFKRNPRYINFSGIGGDCTSFISQCINAGGAPMNYKKTFGWYYNSAADRTPSWSGVEYLYNFLIKNKSTGPKAMEIVMEELEPGDIIQLSFYRHLFSHSLIVVEKDAETDMSGILIATHTEDSDYRPLSSYQQVLAYRYLKISV